MVSKDNLIQLSMSVMTMHAVREHLPLLHSAHIDVAHILGHTTEGLLPLSVRDHLNGNQERIQAGFVTRHLTPRRTLSANGLSQQCWEPVLGAL